MATVTGRDDVITEAGGVEEERGARGTSPLPSVANDDENNDPGDPPAYPGNEGEGQEMVVIGRGATKVEEPTVTFIARDETSESSSPPPLNYDFSVSTSLESVYSTFAGAAGYVGGTFSLIWKKTRGSTSSTEDEQEVFEKSTATLFETGMEGGKEYLVIRKKDGVDLEKKKSVSTYSSSGQGSKVTPTTLNNVRSTGGGNYGSSNYSSSYGGYSNYSYNYSYKSDTGYVGLVNQAMTCYLNSLLQTLYMTPEFRNALYQWRFTSGDDGAKCIPYQLQKLFIHLQTSEKRAVETTDVTKSFGWDSSEAWQQHDVQELCRVMFDALEKRFKKDKHDEADLINHLYQGTLQDYVKCLECGYESAREDHFLDIPLVIKPFGSNKAYSSVVRPVQYFTHFPIIRADHHPVQYFTHFPIIRADHHSSYTVEPSTVQSSSIFHSFPYN
jgi:ubiquitin carboxyl-terminal hydrolase 47